MQSVAFQGADAVEVFKQWQQMGKSEGGGTIKLMEIKIKTGMMIKRRKNIRLLNIQYRNTILAFGNN
ncbi:hypothetical protein [Arachidicoccus rhizosphaerae]|uniref:hypothetical protein n=1 Tax=Arachidicoccus rhizosphaerae TaxID=551991 RepID=UPI001FCDBC3A|nr:hypothetical protein [Arachidicoccus rhizosphaerae]